VKRLAEALIDQLFGSASAAECQQLMAAEWPAQPIQAWLARLAEPLACYDNTVVLDALWGPWT
jgi:hypothetical protein